MRWLFSYVTVSADAVCYVASCYYRSLGSSLPTPGYDISSFQHHHHCFYHSSVAFAVHPVHAMNAEQRQTAADLWTKPPYVRHMLACRQLGNNIHHRHLLLLNSKADPTEGRRRGRPRWLVTYQDGWLDREQSVSCLRVTTLPNSGMVRRRPQMWVITLNILCDRLPIEGAKFYINVYWFMRKSLMFYADV